MPYSIQSSSSETHKETIIPVQPDHKTYIENQQAESTTTTHVVNSDQVDSEGIEHKPIPKKCALDFFKNIIKENESEQNFLKETEKPLPPSFYTDSKKEVYHHVEKSESVGNQYQPSAFPHADSEIPSDFSRSTFSETKNQNTWKPVSPVPQPYQAPYNDTPLYLEPGPPPEMCYAPPAKPKESFTDRIKKMEETHKESYTADAPSAGVKITPEKRPVVEEQCTRTTVDSSGQRDYSFGGKVTSPPTHHPEYNGHGPVLRPQADIHVRPTSPRPSAEGVSMEKLWTTKIHKETEIVRPASPLARPPSPKVISKIRESSHSEVRRCVSPRPSAEGVKMDKMWAHASNNRTPHPSSLMPEIPVPVPEKKDAEDEEAKRLAWSRKYLHEEEVSSSRTINTAATQSVPPPTPTPVYKPPTPAPVYKAPTPVYKPPTPAPAYNPPKQTPTPTPQFPPKPSYVSAPSPPKPSYVAAPPPPYAAPVHHVSPPRELPKQQSSFDQSSSYKQQQSSYQSNQKVSAPWVKTETPQNVVTPPWVKPSPPSTPSHSSVSQNFSSTEDRSYSSNTQQKPVQFNNYSKPNNAYPPFQPKPAANQFYKVESQENESKQYKTPSFSPYTNQNTNQSNSSVVQQSYSSQTVQESYQSGSNQFSNAQQIPGSFSESSVVEEHHLKPSLANKVWPLVQNSSYIPVVPNFTSEPVTESSYSHELIKTDNGYIEKEIKTQKSVHHEEKKFSYPPPSRSALQSKIAAFEEKNYHSDYDSRFDSSDSEMRRRSGSLKRLDRPSSVTGYKTLPKTYGRSNTYNMEYQTQAFTNSGTSEVYPGLKPGSPPQILHASQLYKKKGHTQGDSGYMADTEETFQSKMTQEGSNMVGCPTKKVRFFFSQHLF